MIKAEYMECKFKQEYKLSGKVYQGYCMIVEYLLS